jgi:hypothetical protein
LMNSLRFSFVIIKNSSPNYGRCFRATAVFSLSPGRYSK